VFVEGLSEWVVRTPAEIMVLLQVSPPVRPKAAPRRKCMLHVYLLRAARLAPTHKQRGP
jgi:hypothetical protein